MCHVICTLAFRRDRASPAPEISGYAEALEYYVTRLQQIDAHSEQLGRKALPIEAERLITGTTATLDGLAQWLNLAPPLSGNYRTFKHTGIPGYSDP